MPTSIYLFGRELARLNPPAYRLDIDAEMFGGLGGGHCTGHIVHNEGHGRSVSRLRNGGHGKWF